MNLTIHSVPTFSTWQLLWATDTIEFQWGICNGLVHRTDKLGTVVEVKGRSNHRAQQHINVASSPLCYSLVNVFLKTEKLVFLSPNLTCITVWLSHNWVIAKGSSVPRHCSGASIDLEQIWKKRKISTFTHIFPHYYLSCTNDFLTSFHRLHWGSLQHEETVKGKRCIKHDCCDKYFRRSFSN